MAAWAETVILISTVGQILQEPTQMMTASAIGLATLAWFRRPTLSWAAACGALFGVAALAKSPFLAAPVAVLVVWLAARDVRRRLPFRHVIVTCASCAMLVIPWSIRNYRVTGGHLVLINAQNLSYPVWLVADGNFHPRESLSEPAPEAPAPDTGVALTYGNPDGSHAIDGPHYPSREYWDRRPVAIDFYNNYMTNFHDNPFETDGGMHNVRVLRNMMINSASHAFCNQPAIGGPVYWIRNIVYHMPGGSTRLTGGAAGAIFYNNTVLSETQAQGASNVHWANNLFLGENSAPATTACLIGPELNLKVKSVRLAATSVT